ncbi:conserved hypothetical protein [Sulfurovum sp. enrichment culture clone C5]|uniref:Uncharacterized protein n=1 Tax=Sulfurovum sp. enrichment culture clone C5 TaxID=497650 RepID=A0A0S4XLN4_9BACT|nr:conserved hypothetical protein [Sulfurovum sp. enrichment culture clone C5]
MTEGQKAFRKNLLAKVHQHPFCKEAKGLDTWNHFLQNGYGVDSSAKLSIGELLNLVEVMNSKSEPRISGTRESDIGYASSKQIYVIDTLWKDKARDKSDLALRKFIKRTIKSMPLHLSNLSKIDASRVITALKRI